MQRERDAIYTQEKDLATATRGMTSYNDHPLPPKFPSSRLKIRALQNETLKRHTKRNENIVLWEYLQLFQGPLELL